MSEAEPKMTSYTIYAQRYYQRNKERIAEQIRLSKYYIDYYSKNKETILMRKKEARDRKKAEAAQASLPASPAPVSLLS